MDRMYVRELHTYLSGRILAVEADVFGLLWPCFLGLEEQLPDLVVRCAKEVLQGPRTFRIKLPHVEGPELAVEDSAEEHHLNHVSETGVLAYHVCDALLQHQHFRSRSPVQTLVGPRREPHRGPRSELSSGHPPSAVGFGDVEPLLLPHLDGLHEGPFRPSGVGELAHHGPAT